MRPCDCDSLPPYAREYVTAMMTTPKMRAQNIAPDFEAPMGNPPKIVNSEVYAILRSRSSKAATAAKVFS